MIIRICIQADGTVKFTTDPLDGDPIFLDPEWVGSMFSGEEGADECAGISVSGGKLESGYVKVFSI